MMIRSRSEGLCISSETPPRANVMAMPTKMAGMEKSLKGARYRTSPLTAKTAMVAASSGGAIPMGLLSRTMRLAHRKPMA